MFGISVVQNFICNIPERLELVKNNTPVVGEVWGDYEFFVNFNDEDNFEEVYSIYEEHIPKLNFYNNLEKDWARVTLALVEEVETSHVVFLNEDQEFFMTKEDWSNIINEAIIENDVDYILMNKIDKYNKKAYVNGELENPDDPSSMIIKMLWDKYPSPGYKEGKYVYFYDGKYAPHKRISVEAVYRTEWFVDRLKEFIQNENIVKDKDLVIMNNQVQPIDIPFKKKNLCNFYEGYYDFYNGMARFPDIFGPEGTYDGGREKAPAALCRKVIESNGEIEVYGDGKQTRSFLYIDECVEGIRRLMESDCKEPLNIGSDEVISINDFAQMIIDISEKEVVIKNIDVPQLGVRGRNSDNTLIKEKLGWSPTQPLRVGIEKTYRWIEM